MCMARLRSPERAEPASESPPREGTQVPEEGRARHARPLSTTSESPLRSGRKGIRITGPGTPVTNFKRSNTLYALAKQNNPPLDRDKDGIACEKA